MRQWYITMPGALAHPLHGMVSIIGVTCWPTTHVMQTLMTSLASVVKSSGQFLLLDQLKRVGRRNMQMHPKGLALTLHFLSPAKYWNMLCWVFVFISSSV